MGLLRSGSSSEEVELVRIETDHFVLVIKGRPFHERYEGLQQYRKFHQDEDMHFTVRGAGVQSVALFDVDEGRLRVRPSYRPIFFENGVYQIVITCRTERRLTFDHEHPAFRQAIDYVGDQPIMMGALHFQNEVGLSTFSICDRSQSLLDVTMEVFPSKLDYKQDYERLLAEVNEEIYNLAFHFIRKTYVGAQTTIEEQPSQTEFYRILQAHFRSFVQALDRIEQQPHHQLVTKHERMRGDRLQRIDSFGRKFLRQRPHLFAEVSRGIPLAGKSLMPQTGLGRKKRLTFDTDENRFVKMMLKRTLEKIEDLYEQMTLPNHWLAASPDPALVASIVQMKQELRQRLRRPFWREIGHVDRSVLSLVMQMAPGYRDAF